MNQSKQPQTGDTQAELILGNSAKRFSGVTSTRLQVASKQLSLLPLVALGEFFLPNNINSIDFL